MDLEQDAMLTAIGQMSMDQAKERWASRWSEFVQSMSRWKSIHALLRMARLNAQKQTIAQSIQDAQKRLFELAGLRKELLSIEREISMEADQIWSLSNLKRDAAEAGAGVREPETFFGESFALGASAAEAPRTHRGKRIYSDKVARAIEAAYLSRIYEESGGDAYLNKLVADEKETQAARRKAQSDIEAKKDEIAESKLRLSAAQDEYDVTKPYAMGLLVADIFRSLAMAIQGEIY